MIKNKGKMRFDIMQKKKKLFMLLCTFIKLITQSFCVFAKITITGLFSKKAPDSSMVALSSIVL